MVAQLRLDGTHEISRSFTEPRKRDQIVAAVGFGRRVIPLKIARAAKVAGHSAPQESRIRNGERMSPTARAAIAVYEAVKADACPFEAAGYNSAFVEVTIRAVAMWPELEKLNADELRRELSREIVEVETRANAICNELEATFLHTGKLSAEAMMEAHTLQATSSTRIVAILQVLANKR